MINLYDFHVHVLYRSNIKYHLYIDFLMQRSLQPQDTAAFSMTNVSGQIWPQYVYQQLGNIGNESVCYGQCIFQVRMFK